MARKIIYLLNPATTVGEDLSDELRLRIIDSQGEPIDNDSYITPLLGTMTPEDIRDRVIVSNDNENPWLQYPGSYININNDRYKGIGKRFRLKRDLNKNPNPIIYNGKTLIDPAGLGSGGAYYTGKDARNLLRSNRKKLDVTEDQDDTGLRMSNNETSKIGMAFKMAKEYFDLNPYASTATFNPYVKKKTVTETNPNGEDQTTPTGGNKETPAVETPPQVTTETPEQKKIELNPDLFFTGFGGNTDYLNGVYKRYNDDQSLDRYKGILEKYDKDQDGLINPEEFNLYRKESGIGDYHDDTLDHHTIVNTFFNDKKPKGRDVSHVTWVNDDWKKKRQKDSNGHYYIDTKDNDAWKDFLRDTYELDDETISQFGSNYSDFLKTIGYTPEKGRETYIDKNVGNKTFEFLHGLGNKRIFIRNGKGAIDLKENLVLKHGGKMNYINYFQAGGTMKQESQDELIRTAIYAYIGYALQQLQKISVELSINAVASMINQNPEAIQLLISNLELASVGYEFAKQDEPEMVAELDKDGVATLAVQSAMLDLTALALAAQVQAARHGAKLNYIKRLKGECPAGYEMAYYKAGGTVCPVCQKKAEEKKVLSAKCGKKMKKGAVSKAMNGIRTEIETKKEGGPAENKSTPKKQDRGLSVRSVKPGSDAAKAVKSAGYTYTNDLPYYVTRYITNAALPDTVYTYGVDDPDMGMEIVSAASPNWKGLRADLKNPKIYARLRNIYELAR